MYAKRFELTVICTLVFGIVFTVSNVLGQHSIRVQRGNDALLFTCVNDRTFEMAYLVGGREDWSSVIIDSAFHPTGIFESVDSIKNGLRIHGKYYSIVVNTQLYVISVYDNKEQLLFSTITDTGFTANACWAKVVKGDYYGLDNRAWGILRWGWDAYVHSSDWGNASGMFTWSTVGLGMVADMDEGPANIDGPAGNFHYIKEKSSRRNNVLYLMVGTPKQIFSECAAIVGKPTMPPFWSLGFIHSKWKQNEQDVYRLANQYRSKDIPVDAFAFDYEWMDWGNPWGEFKWNSIGFPSAQSGQFADSLKHLGITLMGIRKPRIHFDEPQGEYARSHGYFFSETLMWDYVSAKRVALLNFFDPEVRRWFWDMTADSARNPFTRGIKAFWNDEDNYKRSMYGTVVQQAQYEGQRSFNKERVFSLNRNYFIGANRFAYGLWSGDISSNFPTLAAQRTIVQNSACLGNGWWSMDIGGYLGASDSTPGISEMYIRWIQLGAFVPFFRIHSVYDKQREPWFYGSNAERICTQYIRLRYTLLPYTYGLFRTFVDEGLPPVRPFIIDYPNEFSLRQETRAFQFGPSIVVAPVVDSLVRTATFNLPSGKWVNYWDDSIIAGGSEVTLSAGLEHIPILMKWGSIIPQREYGTYTLDSNAFRDIRFHIYGGGTDSLIYYEDDFNTYDYEKGMYTKIPYSHRFIKGVESILIGQQNGNYHIKKRRGYFIFHCLESPVAAVHYDHLPLRNISLDSVYHSSAEGWALDTSKHQLIVALSDPFRPSEIEIDPEKYSSQDSDILFSTSVDVFPNPTEHSIRCVVSVPNDEQIEARVATETGVVVLQKSQQLHQGKNILDLGTSVLSPGAYFITMQSSNWKRTARAVVVAR